MCPCGILPRLWGPDRAHSTPEPVTGPPSVHPGTWGAVRLPWRVDSGDEHPTPKSPLSRSSRHGRGQGALQRARWSRVPEPTGTGLPGSPGQHAKGPDDVRCPDSSLGTGRTKGISRLAHVLGAGTGDRSRQRHMSVSVCTCACAVCACTVCACAVCAGVCARVQCVHVQCVRARVQCVRVLRVLVCMCCVCRYTFDHGCPDRTCARAQVFVTSLVTCGRVAHSWHVRADGTELAVNCVGHAGSRKVCSLIPVGSGFDESHDVLTIFPVKVSSSI